MNVHEWNVMYAKKVQGVWKRSGQKVLFSVKREGQSTHVQVHLNNRIMESFQLASRSLIYTVNNKKISFYFHGQEVREFTVAFDSITETLECRSLLASLSDGAGVQPSQFQPEFQSQSQYESSEMDLSPSEHQHLQSQQAVSARDYGASKEADLVEERKQKELPSTIARLLKDPKFNALVAAIETVMEADPNLFKEFIEG